MAAALVLLSCRGDDEASSSLLARVERRDFREELATVGTAYSANTVTLAVGHNTNGKVAFAVENGIDVKKGDTLCIVESTGLAQEMDNLLTMKKNAEAELVKTEATYAMERAVMEAHVATGAAEAQISALDSLQLEFSPVLQRRISELNLRKASIERERYTRQMRVQEVIHRVDVQRIHTFIAALGRRIADMQERIDALTVTAPADGIALLADAPADRRRRLTIGDEVWERCPLVVMPDLSHMEVLIEAPENEYKRMDVGDSVRFTFSAIPDSVAWGHIVRKLPVGKDVGAGKVKMFDVTASIDSSGVVVMPQSTTQCVVCLRELKDTLVVPAVCVYDRDSLKVVYVHRPGGMAEERVVTVAAASTNEVVIADGVSEGEQLWMLKPADRKVKRMKK